MLQSVNYHPLEQSLGPIVRTKVARPYPHRLHTLGIIGLSLQQLVSA